jgi:hypothetical protein
MSHEATNATFALGAATRAFALHRHRRRERPRKSDRSRAKRAVRFAHVTRRFRPPTFVQLGSPRLRGRGDSPRCTSPPACDPFRVQRELKPQICADCGKAPPPTATSYTLFSAKFGWRVASERAQDGGMIFHWRCPECWAAYKRMRAAGRAARTSDASPQEGSYPSSGSRIALRKMSATRAEITAWRRAKG